MPGLATKDAMRAGHGIANERDKIPLARWINPITGWPYFPAQNLAIAVRRTVRGWPGEMLLLPSAVAQ